jgi:hypothetical protein
MAEVKKGNRVSFPFAPPPILNGTDGRAESGTIFWPVSIRGVEASLHAPDFAFGGA